MLRYTPGMGASLLVSEQEYLTTSYEPDCDYDDGELLERNVGERPHSILETAFGAFFFERRKRFRIQVLTDQRIRIAPRRYRVPDVCVYKEPAPRDRIFSTPPFIAIEILSPRRSLRVAHRS
jgi:Uma2 family endonuclease